MSRIDEVLELKNLAPSAREELKDAKQALLDLNAISQVSQSEGGKRLQEVLKEDCRDLILKMLKAKDENKMDNVMACLSDFQAKFTLFNTIKTASDDHTEGVETLEKKIEEILDN